MKAEQANVEIKCPKCGHINRIMGIPPSGGHRKMNEKVIIDYAGAHRAEDYKKRIFRHMEATLLTE